MTTDDGDDVGISPTKEQRAGRAFSEIGACATVRWFDHEEAIHLGCMCTYSLDQFDHPRSAGQLLLFLQARPSTAADHEFALAGKVRKKR